jgi:hypothetical protein
MDAAKDIHKEMLPIWATLLCGYPLLHRKCYGTEQTINVFPNKLITYLTHLLIDLSNFYLVKCKHLPY